MLHCNNSFLLAALLTTANVTCSATYFVFKKLQKCKGLMERNGFFFPKSECNRKSVRNSFLGLDIFYGLDFWKLLFPLLLHPLPSPWVTEFSVNYSWSTLLLSQVRISSIVFSGIFLSSFGTLSFPVLLLHFNFDLFVRNAASQSSGITIFMLLVTTQTTKHFVSGRKKQTS